MRLHLLGAAVSLVLAALPLLPQQIASDCPPPATGETPYSFQVTTSQFARTPVHYGFGLPPGMQMSAAGEISGRPTTVGEYRILLLALLTAGDVRQAAEQICSLTARAPAPALIIVSDSALPDASEQIDYRHALSAQGGSPPYQWALEIGAAVPEGLALSADGLISGRPASPGAAEFRIHVRDTQALSYPLALRPGLRLYWLFRCSTPTPARFGSGFGALAQAGRVALG